MASIKLNNYEIFSQSGDAAPKLNNSTGLNFSTTNQNFTIKGIDAPIVGATNSTEDNPNSGQLAIYNGATKLWGINESGWVQQPNRPAFSAYGRAAGSGNVTYSAGNTVVFDQATRYNIGNCYDLSNSRFTAPIDGIYFFSANCFNNSTSNKRVQLYSSNAGPFWGQGGSSPGTDFRTSGAIFLYAGDYVFVRNSYDGTIIYHAAGHNEFNGCLIG